MFRELGQAELDHLLPLLRSVPQDPMLYMVLEGNRQGHIFADRPSDPSAALIWTGMEYAYLIGEAAGCRAEVVHVVEHVILPALENDGLGFVTIFPHGVSPGAVQAWFPERQPVSFGVNSFTFEPERYERLRLQAKPLPSGYARVRLDRHNLDQAPWQDIQQDILFCWESLERFEALGLGYGISSPQGEVVSACYAIAYGAEAFHINIWTHHGHRRRGLARQAAIGFLEESLPNDRTIYWINDAPNIASRRLAESVGFVYARDLATVDIPVHPHYFHLSLAEHFASYLELYREAGELYDQAFAIQAGDAEAYHQAALVWQQAGDPTKAEMCRQKAIGYR
jgi:RimJ/RimL family protein N-acetyltransferase